MSELNYANVIVPVAIVAATAAALYYVNRESAKKVTESEVSYVVAARYNKIKLFQDIQASKKVIRIDEQKDEDGNTPLMVASKYGHKDLVDILLQLGANPNLRNSAQWLPLHFAVFSVNYDLMVVLHGKTVNQNVDLKTDDGWTYLLLSCIQGDLSMASYFLKLGANVNSQNAAGQSPLIIAACNGHHDLVTLLLSRDADPLLKTGKLETALYLASLNGHDKIVETLLSLPSAAEQLSMHNLQGSTPLHAAAGQGNVKILALLIGAGADVNALSRDDSTPLFRAVEHNRLEAVEALTSYGALLNMMNRYGSSVLHKAAYDGNAELVQLLLSAGASPNSRDNDGLSPLHSCCSARKPAGNSDYVGSARALLLHGGEVNSLDRSKSTPLHQLPYADRVVGERLAQLLLESGADPSLESASAWNPLHFAYSEKNEGLIKVIEAHAAKHCPAFLASFDKNKPREFHRDVGYTGRLTEEQRQSIFDGKQPSIDAIAQRIQNGKSKNIVVLLGAGVSTSAGIPDFRNPNSGVYSGTTAAKYSLPSPSAAFDLGYMNVNPKPFYALVKDMFLPVRTGHTKPTPTHHFLKLLHDHGILTRVYTQNIDGLDFKVGLPESKVVEAHGSFKRVFCMKCRRPEDVGAWWDHVAAEEVMFCKHCGGAIRPDVVFFGEPLQTNFFECSMKDMRACDLLIVIGTSLKVYPFAALVNDVSATCPRILFNKEEAGPFKANKSAGGMAIVQDDYRDVAFLGECDYGVQTLVQILGWQDELAALMRS